MAVLSNRLASMFSLVSPETSITEHALLVVVPCTVNMEKKQKKIMIGNEARKIVCNVYRFLKIEHELTLLYHDPKCDLSHLRNITKRTAEAIGISLRSVQRILQEEKQYEELEELDRANIEKGGKRKIEAEDKEKNEEKKNKKKVKKVNEDNEIEESKGSNQFDVYVHSKSKS